jgi:predicted RNase H-like HicB family nuclease
VDKRYPIVVVPLPPEEGGGFMGYLPDLRGCMSDGDTYEQALANAQQAALEWIEEAKASGHPIPEPGSAAAKVQQNRDQLLKKVQLQADEIETLVKDTQRLSDEAHRLRNVIEIVTERLGDLPMWAGFVPSAHSSRHGTDEPVH